MTSALNTPVSYRYVPVEDEEELYLEESPSAVELAEMLLGIIGNDRDRYIRIDRYVEGRHDGPYMPIGADTEYKLLANRSVTNLMPLLLNTPAQALYVDSFRSGASNPSDTEDTVSAEWQHWQNSRLDARQLAIHRGALKYGHSFAVTERVLRYGQEMIQTRGLSALNTAAVYEDAANDIDPYAALTIVREPNSKAKSASGRRGLAYLWDGFNKYEVRFQSLGNDDSIRVLDMGPHGLSECPVTRFAATVDLEGRTVGVIEPNIPIQDRINQTVFDLLVAQTYGSFKVRTVTGMAPPMRRWSQAMIDGEIPIPYEPPEGTEAGDPIIDPVTGKPIAEAINLNARRFFFAEDDKVKFGALDGTSLEGYIRSLDMSIRHLSVATQTPPHYLLGEIANLSAEALQAAETSLLRKVEEYRKGFGESWERIFRLAGHLAGNLSSALDYAGEVLWRDTEMRSLSATADALSKLADLGIPLQGLWERVPETTRTEISNWLKMRDTDIKFRKQLAEVSAQAVAAELQAESFAQNAPQGNGGE